MKKFKILGKEAFLLADGIEEAGSSYPDDTFWRHKDPKVDPRVFYIQDQKRRHVEAKAWKPMSEEKSVTWADIEILSKEKWTKFLRDVEKGLPIEKWPEEEEENHHTENVYKIAHSTPIKSGVIQECADLGFNVIHTGGTCGMDAGGVNNFLGKCEDAGIRGLPRVDGSSRVSSILKTIKNHPALLGIMSNDESECEHVDLEEQYRYFQQVKNATPKLLVFRNWNGVNREYWKEYFPSKHKIKESCDIILKTSYIWYKPGGPEKWRREEKTRFFSYINSKTPFIPILQGWYDPDRPRPNINLQWDWNFWKGICNSYAIWLHGAGAKNIGFGEDDDLQEQVRKLNEEAH